MLQEHLLVCLRSVAKGKESEDKWQAAYDNFLNKYADEGKELKQILSGELPAGFENNLPKFSADDKGLATR